MITSSRAIASCDSRAFALVRLIDRAGRFSATSNGRLNECPRDVPDVATEIENDCNQSA